MKINWKEVWEKFDSWYASRDRGCIRCGKADAPEWEDQKKKIARIVSEHIFRRRPIKSKRSSDRGEK